MAPPSRSHSDMSLNELDPGWELNDGDTFTEYNPNDQPASGHSILRQGVAVTSVECTQDSHVVPPSDGSSSTFAEDQIPQEESFSDLERDYGSLRPAPATALPTAPSTAPPTAPSTAPPTYEAAVSETAAADPAAPRSMRAQAVAGDSTTSLRPHRSAQTSSRSHRATTGSASASSALRSNSSRPQNTPLENMVFGELPSHNRSTNVHTTRTSASALRVDIQPLDPVTSRLERVGELSTLDTGAGPLRSGGSSRSSSRRSDGTLSASRSGGDFTPLVFSKGASSVSVSVKGDVVITNNINIGGSGERSSGSRATSARASSDKATHIPAAGSTRRLSTQDVEILARQLGDAWMDLGKSIGVSKGELENIRYKHEQSRDQSEMARQMLLRWKGVYGHNATIDYIVQALTDKRLGLYRVAAALPRDEQ